MAEETDSQTPTERPTRLPASAGYPSYAARHRQGQETMELRVPTGNEDNPHCWHGLDLAAAKRLRYEICEAVDSLDALMDFRQWSSDKELVKCEPVKI